MSEIVTIGLDPAKRVFQVHGADGSGQVILRKKLSRDQMLPFFSALPPCTVAMGLRRLAFLGTGDCPAGP